ncbi:hypothetical protein C7405_101738 [Paraburkholderia caballeronis]|nr:hypothetical protein C7405_101738 [Paraburkholderia caballeronis]
MRRAVRAAVAAVGMVAAIGGTTAALAGGYREEWNPPEPAQRVVAKRASAAGNGAPVRAAGSRGKGNAAPAKTRAERIAHRSAAVHGARARKAPARPASLAAHGRHAPRLAAAGSSKATRRTAPGVARADAGASRPAGVARRIPPAMQPASRRKLVVETRPATPKNPPSLPRRELPPILG